jgi:hypothetical protein
LLENAGINENITADIVGHEKPRMTYGLYSGGATLQVKRQAVAKVRYNFSVSQTKATKALSQKTTAKKTPAKKSQKIPR